MRRQLALLSAVLAGGLPWLSPATATAPANADTVASTYTTWGLLADLNGDGRSEVVQETYEEVDPGEQVQSLTLLDGSSGQALWNASSAYSCATDYCLVYPTVRLLHRQSAVDAVLVDWTADDDAGNRLNVVAYEPLTGVQRWKFQLPEPRGCGDEWMAGTSGIARLDGDEVDDVVVATESCERHGRLPAYVVNGASGDVEQTLRAHWPIPIPGMRGPQRPAALVDAALMQLVRGRVTVTARTVGGRLLWSRRLPATVGGAFLTPAQPLELSGGVTAAPRVADVTGDGTSDVLVSGHDRANLHPFYFAVLDGRTGRTSFGRTRLYSSGQLLASRTKSTPERLAYTYYRTNCMHDCEVYEVYDAAHHPVWQSRSVFAPVGDIDGDGVQDVTGGGHHLEIRSGLDGHVLARGLPVMAEFLFTALDGHGDDFVMTHRHGPDTVVVARDGLSQHKLWQTRLKDARELDAEAAGGPAGTLLISWRNGDQKGVTILAAADGHVLWRTDQYDVSA